MVIILNVNYLFSKNINPNEHLNYKNLCSNSSNWLECTTIIEKKRKNKFFKRIKNNLIIQLMNNKTIKFTNTDNKKSTNQTIKYSYFAFLDKINYHIVHVLYYEGSNNFLINHKNGRKYLLEKFPIFSDDFKRFAVVDIGVYSKNIIQIWKINKDSIKLEWSQKIDFSDNEEVLNVNWKSYNALEIEFKIYKKTNTGNKTYKTKKELKMINNKWNGIATKIK